MSTLKLLKALIEKADFKALSQFASTRFFLVVPLGACFKIVSRVFVQANKRKACTEVRAAIQNTLAPLGVIVPEAPNQSHSRHPLNEASAKIVLKVYFQQILYAPKWMLDFRRECWHFADQAQQAEWYPNNFYHEPTTAFQNAVIGLYGGFYSNDDNAFRSSLETLGLSAAETEIRAHFGANQQTAVRFSVAELQRSFANIFQACEKYKASIHPEFVILGVMLVSLYDTLEQTQCAIDVRGLWESLLKNNNGT